VANSGPHSGMKPYTKGSRPIPLQSHGSQPIEHAHPAEPPPEDDRPRVPELDREKPLEPDDALLPDGAPAGVEDQLDTETVDEAVKPGRRRRRRRAETRNLSS